jgi:polar amino acid transport system substrate-binding protein
VAPPPSLGSTISLAAQIERPLVDDGVAGGGLMTELVMASLDATTANSASPPKIAVDWAAAAGEGERRLIADHTADLGFPWRKPACRSGDTDADATAACRDLAYSEPVFQVVNGFFARSEGDFAFTADEQVIGRIICVPEGSDLADLEGNGRNWISQDLLTLLRAPSLDACLQMVAKGEADAAFADEFSGRAAIARLGLGDDIEMADRPVSTTALHVAVAKSNPRASDLIQAVDLGLGELKRSGKYAEIVARQLTILWGGQPSQ